MVIHLRTNANRYLIADVLADAAREKEELKAKLNDKTTKEKEVSTLKEALVDLQKLNEELGNEKIQLNQVQDKAITTIKAIFNNLQLLQKFTKIQFF